MTPSGGNSLVDVGHAGSALDGIHSGDAHVVAPFSSGVLLAVIDGLGHGREAGDAARAAAHVLVANAAEPLVPLIQRCHDALRSTRGVVMSIASLLAADASLSWLGVGNVEGLLLRADRRTRPSSESIELRGGVIGYQLPPLRVATLALGHNDLLILASDGVHHSFVSGLTIEHSPQRLAEAILRRHARGNDDAHVVVARYLGGAA